MARITINGVSLDPIDQSDALRGAALESVDASRSNYVLVQTAGPLTGSEKARLAEVGAVIHEYVSENTYLCGYGPSDLQPLRALPFVAWANVYLEGFKLPPSLRPAQPDPATAIVAVSGNRSLSRALRDVEVVVHDDIDPNDRAVVEAIAQAAGVDTDGLEVGRRKVRLTMREDRLGDLANLDIVRTIEEVPERSLFNNVARPILNADVLINGTSYLGDGEVVAVADTGFDKGSTTDVHPAFTGRVAKLYPLGRPSRTDDPEGHGTHVAGSVLGDGNSPTMGGVIQGTAPRARLVLQSLIGTNRKLVGIPADLHDLFQPPYDDDLARVHTNSWGDSRPAIPYSNASTEIDDFVWNHPDIVICWAAGNAGVDANGNGVIDAGAIGAEAAAKNCITVGACESVRPDFDETYGHFAPASFPKDPINRDRFADNSDGMAAFSSRGPTQEGRIKPDIVAPGTSILSTLSRKASDPGIFGTSKDALYFFDTGTSMATPLVAGCVAVLRETLVKNGAPTPSAALVKALLVNGAVELAGQYTPTEAGASPNFSSGFGRVDLAGSVIVPGPDTNGGFGEGGPLEQGQEETVTVEIPEIPPGQNDRGGAGIGVTFKVTLVWSDPPGPSLQNDLDLIVRASDGRERHGNMGTSDGFDRSNNVEQVLWAGIPAGPAEIIVRAFRITRFAQPYAFAWRLS